MYDLAPRFPEHCVKDDSPVGPTTYFVSNLECKKCKESTYPLTSKCSRFKVRNVIDSPSPAHYYPKYRKHRIVGGKSLQYTTPRICIVPKKNVSHTSYPFMQEFTKTSMQFTKSPPKTNRSMFKHWYSCRRSEISDTTREIVLRQVSTMKPLPDYLKYGETCKASIKYRGSRWAQYTSQRSSIGIKSDTPGPGAYNISPPEKVPNVFTRPPIKEYARRKCITPVDETQPALQEIDDDENGDKISHYFDGTCDYLYKKVSHNKSPFGLWSKSNRFTYHSNENPPPWAYCPSGRIGCVRKIVKIVPFLACSSRFEIPKMSDLSPASYQQKYKTIREATCQILPKVRALVAPFGSTAPRLTPLPQDSSEEEDEPEQQDYLTVTKLNLDLPETSARITEETKSESSEDKAMYQIVGTSLVLRDIVPKKTDLVDMREVFNNWKAKKSHRRPKENEAFLSASGNRTAWLVAKTPAHNVNWSAIDDVKVQGGAIKMNIPVHNKNPKLKQDQSVYYDIHPQYSSSVYKTTHNYMLKTDSEIEKAYDNPDNVKTILKCFMPKEILNA